MTFKHFLSSAVMALSLSACTTQIIYADSYDSGQEHETTPGTSSFGPPVDPTTGTGEPEGSTTGLLGSTGAASSSTGGSTGGESSGTGAGSTSGSSSSSSSTGEGGSSTGGDSSTGDPVMSCEFADACMGGVCAPDGSCVAACQGDGRCAGDELCLAGGCVDVSDDMMEGQLVGFNDSPIGAVSSTDIDVWKVKLQSPGDYAVTVSGKPVSAFILSGQGDIVATPADAEILDIDGKMARYSFTVVDSTLPIAVILMSASKEPVAYWFATST